MGISDIIRLARRTGRIAEAAPPGPPPNPVVPPALRGSVQLRHVDAGSCNGCEIEIEEEGVAGGRLRVVGQRVYEPHPHFHVDRGYQHIRNVGGADAEVAE